MESISISIFLIDVYFNYFNRFNSSIIKSKYQISIRLSDKIKFIPKKTMVVLNLKNLRSQNLLKKELISFLTYFYKHSRFPRIRNIAI